MFKRVSTILLWLAPLVVSQPLFAHLPELYGREYVRVDPENFEPPENQQNPRILTPASKAETGYEAQVRQIEASAGPYSSGLADPLTNLSHTQLERGDPEEAAASLRRALHLVRVNEGLYSRNQLPLLRQLISLLRKERDYRGLGAVYAYYYRVSGLNKGPYEKAHLGDALEYLDWERQLYATRDDGAQRTHLVRAYLANDEMLTAAEGAPLSAYLTLAMSQLRNLYLVLGDRDMSMEMTPGGGMGSVEERRLAILQETAYRKGLRLLDKCLDKAADASPEQRAKILLERGDWQHWNGHFRSAESHYAKVSRLMEEAGKLDELAHWFDEPVELPNKDNLWPLIHEENGRTPVIIEASFIVNSNGDARSIDASANTEEDEWQASRIRAMLRDTHFRPRIGTDGAETSARVTRHYRLIAIN